jgi:hypothetical protein
MWWGSLQRGDLVSSVTSDWCLAPHSRGFCNTHSDAPQSVGRLWTNSQLVAETSTWQHTTLTTDRHPYPSGIWTHDLSRRAAIDLHLRPCGHWYQLYRYKIQNCIHTNTDHNLGFFFFQIGGTYMKPLILPSQVAIGALGKIQVMSL